MSSLAAVLLALLLALGAAPAAGATATTTAGTVGAGMASPTHAGECDAAGAGLPVAATSAALPIGAGSCPGVRPGAGILVDDTSLCTLNFGFTGRDAQGGTHTYMGTAGHCAFGAALSPPVQRVWPPGQGPVVADSTGRRIGTFAYAIVSGDRDFGLVRLDAGVPASAQLCQFGGPTGVNHDRSSATTTLRYYGRGFGVSAVLPARTAVAHGMPDEGHVHAVGAAVPGDSGAGVVSADGRAVGLVITTGVHSGQIGTAGTDVGTVGIARLGPVTKRAATALRQQLTLHTAARR